MPVINYRRTIGEKLAKSIAGVIKPFIHEDHKLISFFDLYLDGLMLQKIILGYDYAIKQDRIEMDITLDRGNRHLLIEINRRNVRYQCSET